MCQICGLLSSYRVTSEPENRGGLARVGIALEVDCGDMGAIVEIQRDVLAGEPLAPVRRFVLQCVPACTFLRHHLGKCHDDIMGHFDAGGIVFPGVGLDQQREAVVQGPVPV